MKVYGMPWTLDKLPIIRGKCLETIKGYYEFFEKSSTIAMYEFFIFSMNLHLLLIIFF